MTYTSEERLSVEKLVHSFNLLDSKQDRLDKLNWYSRATGIHDAAKVKRIMKDINAI